MHALSSTIDGIGVLGIILFEQSPAKCFTSILADVDYTIGLGDIVSTIIAITTISFTHTILRTITIFSRYGRYLKISPLAFQSNNY
jgi:hypothetical protein